MLRRVGVRGDASRANRYQPFRAVRIAVRITERVAVRCTCHGWHEPPVKVAGACEDPRALPNVARPGILRSRLNCTGRFTRTVEELLVSPPATEAFVSRCRPYRLGRVPAHFREERASHGANVVPA